MKKYDLNMIKEHVGLCANNAKIYGERWYLYYDIISGGFSVTKAYRRDWHFMAWPGGRTEMSPDFAKMMGYDPQQVAR